MELNKYIKDIKDYPKPGITFKDVSPLLANPEAFSHSIDEMIKLIDEADVIVSPDARGFLFGTPIAYKMKKPFVMVRKPNKLPGETIAEEYDLEYGTNTLEIQKDSLKPGQKVVIVDDILATGGTVNAIIKLVEDQGAVVHKIVFLAELSFLGGKEKINHKNIESLIKF